VARPAERSIGRIALEVCRKQGGTRIYLSEELISSKEKRAGYYTRCSRAGFNCNRCYDQFPLLRYGWREESANADRERLNFRSRTALPFRPEGIFVTSPTADRPSPLDFTGAMGILTSSYIVTSATQSLKFPPRHGKTCATNISSWEPPLPSSKPKCTETKGALGPSDLVRVF